MRPYKYVPGSRNNGGHVSTFLGEGILAKGNSETEVD